MNKGLFLDLDSTVRRSKSGKVTPDNPEDQEVLPGRHKKIHEYKDSGHKIIAITNQGGIAAGFTTHDQVKRNLFALNEDLGRPFDAMLYCGSDAKSNDPRRKPNPGMIHEAAEKHNIDLAKSLFVGDMESDAEAAKRAGVPFQWAHEFFKEGA
jgi:D-glycero-D-manno-heptose 1,7-bisphosphate phosphatase